jgi:hypothetical protein
MPDTEQPTSTNETTAPPSPSVAPTTSPEWRAGGGRFAGMTAAEILGVAEGQSAALENANSMLQRFNQPIQEQPKNRFDMDLPADDSEYLQVGQVRRLISNLANQPAPVDQRARQLAAESLFGNLQQSRADEFKRWGSEIRAEIAKLHVDYWTYDALNTIVNMVRANHVDELVAEKAQRLANESHPTIRSGTGGLGSGSHTQPIFETGPKDMLARLKAVGISSEAELRQACAGTGIEPDQYLAELEKYGKGAIIRG